jgi:hypothetical protein
MVASRLFPFARSRVSRKLLRCAIARIAVLVVGLALVDAASAAILVLDQDAVTAAVTRRLFPDGGRRMFAGSMNSCSHAYAEQPSIVFRGGRIVLRMRFAGRAGVDTGSGCVGGSEAFFTTLSGQPYVQGETIGIRDVRMEEGKREYRELLEPLMRRQLPSLLGSNLRQELARFLDATVPDFHLDVTQFQLQDVSAADGALSVRFEFALHGRGRR